MRSVKPIHINWYVFSDALAAAVSWLLFAVIRSQLLHEPPNEIWHSILTNPYYQVTFLFIPVFWVALWSLTGSYRLSLYRKSRLNELTNTFIISIVGCLILFFLIILNDLSVRYTYYYQAFFCFWLIQFGITFMGRVFILRIVKGHLLNGYIRLNTLIVGNNAGAVKIYKQVQKNFTGLGYNMRGFINTRP